MNNQLPTFTPLSIAAYFFYLASVDKKGFTHLQVQKLVFLAYGYMLTIYNQRLIKTPTHIWKFGPIYPSIFEKLKHVKMTPFHFHEIPDSYKWGIGKILNYSYNKKYPVRELLQAVYNAYGDYSASELSTLTYKLVGMDKRIPLRWKINFLFNRTVFCTDEYLIHSFKTLPATLEG